MGGISAACSTETTSGKTSRMSRTISTRRNADERYDESMDKMYADFVKFEASGKLPHMEWDGSDFVPQRPAPQPVLQVNATIMVSAHKKFVCLGKEAVVDCIRVERSMASPTVDVRCPWLDLISWKKLGAPKNSSSQLATASWESHARH